MKTDLPGMTVDIVVNNFNYGRYVGAAIESALAQTHPGVNVIVVDDGSTDGSRVVLRPYEESVDLVLKENGGQASAVNAGFLRCFGDAVIFLDADDVLLPEAAALAAAAFASDPLVSMVQYRMEVMDGDGRRTGIIKPPPHLPVPQGDLRHAELVFPFDLVWLPMSAISFRADALRRILPIPEAEWPVCGADWYLKHLTALLGTVVSLEQVGACYRVHGANRYEPDTPVLDLEHVRHGLRHADSTARALTRLATDLGLHRPYDRILSVADLSNRLVSLKLEPRRHPIPTDSLTRLAIDGTRAAGRRTDVAWSMKLLYGCWFWVMAALPVALARRLAELFLFPERRGALNHVLGYLHARGNGARAEADPVPSISDS
jgi:glycosyltransferase involved in cell wall biosynthesis